MKKRIFAALIAALMIVTLFCGCSDKIDKQVDTIIGNINTWRFETEEGTTIYSYAVTDLDQNGRLEIAAAMNYGSENTTVTRYYELNEEKTRLTELEHSYVEDAQADVLFGSAKYFKNTETGQIYYVFTDINKKNIREIYTSKIAVSLYNGKVTEELLATEKAVYNDGIEDYEYSYVDAEGNSITSTDYNNVDRICFKGYDTGNATIGWKGYTYTTHANKIVKSNEELHKILRSSYDSFVVD